MLSRAVFRPTGNATLATLWAQVDDPEKELIQPAVEGTNNVMRAAVELSRAIP